MADIKTNDELLAARGQLDGLKRALRAETSANAEAQKSLKELRILRELVAVRMNDKDRLRRQAAGLCLSGYFSRKGFEADSENVEARALAEEAIKDALERADELLLNEDPEEEYREASEEIAARAKEFGDSYSYYLSQIKLMSDMLSEAAANVADKLFTGAESDTAGLFNGEMAKSLEKRGGKARED